MALIGVDWGSSSVRAFCITSDGAVVDTRRADDGVFVGAGAFDRRLRNFLGNWLEHWPDAPILLCGMVGSDSGWMAAPYARATCGLDNIANGLVAVPFDRPAHIVPGVSFMVGDDCEVMRGEETQLMGLAVFEPRATVCLPGTHTKWVDLADGRIAAFRTHMTGELRALLLSDSGLATPMTQAASPAAFRAGMLLSFEGAAVARSLFQARARRLLGKLPAEHTASFISGVLIGHEISSEARDARPSASLILAARGALADEYRVALSQAGLAAMVVDPELLVARGMFRIAARAGFFDKRGM